MILSEYAILELREQLAALEHEQWAHWTKHLLRVLDPMLTPEATVIQPHIRRWEKQIATSYEDLNEQEKKSDQDWANRVMEILGACGIVEQEDFVDAALHRVAATQGKKE